MKLYKYKNYDEYVKSQRKACEKKHKNVWVNEENIKFLCDILQERKPVFGICHGVRQGFEQQYFKKYLKNAEVIGTEIGETTAPNTIQWDFNKENPEWLGKCDFVYSNSFDHSYDPKQTIKTWANQLKKGGLLIIEYDRQNEHKGDISQPVNKTDPLSIDAREMIEKIPEWSNRLEVYGVIQMPVVRRDYQYAVIFECVKD